MLFLELSIIGERLSLLLENGVPKYFCHFNSLRTKIHILVFSRKKRNNLIAFSTEKFLPPSEEKHTKNKKKFRKV